MNNKVADVGNPREQVGKDENRIMTGQCIRQDDQRAGQAQPPE